LEAEAEAEAETQPHCPAVQAMEKPTRHMYMGCGPAQPVPAVALGADVGAAETSSVDAAPSQGQGDWHARPAMAPLYASFLLGRPVPWGTGGMACDWSAFSTSTTYELTEQEPLPGCSTTALLVTSAEIS